MNNSGDDQKKEFRQAVTTTVIWVAGVTLIVIFVALFIGIELDKIFQTKPIFTIILTIASIPTTIFTTIRIVNITTKKLPKSKNLGVIREKNQ